jgi:uncharacterized RDD family membrane protein YckC
VNHRPGSAGRPAGFWIRVLAAVLDALVCSLVQFSLGFAAGSLWGREVASSPAFRSTIVVFTLLFALLYTAVLHGGPGQTVGKLVVGVRVVALDGEALGFGAALLRSLAYLVSFLPLGAGFIMAGLRRDKRALHDLLAGSRVEWLPRRRAAAPVGEQPRVTPEPVAPA